MTLPKNRMFASKVFVGMVLFAIVLQNEIMMTEGLAGFGKQAGTASKSSNKKKSKKRKQSLILTDVKKEEWTTSSVPSPPQLDRFGLPIQTAEDVFPPLDRNIHRITSASGNDEIELSGIQDILRDEGCLQIDAEVCRKLNVKVNLLHRSPCVLEIENFFSEDECKEYMAITGDLEEKNALMVESPKFSTEALSRRTSTTWFCKYSSVPSLLAKATNILKKPVEYFEEPQVVRYRTGEEFTWHYDEIPKIQLVNGGQRIATLLVYLNTLSEDQGGATIFRDLLDKGGGQLKVSPKMGNALLFFPALANGSPDDRTLHKGELSKSQKVIAQCWVHESDYTPAVPSGNNHADSRESIETTEIKLGLRDM